MRWVLLLALTASPVLASDERCPALAQLERDLNALVTVDNGPSTGEVAAALASLTAVAVFDHELQRSGEGRLPDGLEHLEPGGRVAAANAVAATLALGGLTVGNRRVMVGGLTLLEGNILLGLALDASKHAFGRARPHEAHAGDLRQGGDSMPSSHAAHAFLIAAVLDATFDTPAVRWPAYALASGVALERIQEGVHFPTDVIVGGALGWWIGHRLAVSHELRTGTGRFRVAWLPVAGGGGVVVQASW